ncbi:MAG: hypothetical protein CML06_08445 [Pseudomonadales bacterium]|nr:hypothetical protein [Pseudomonadales bacterium]
MERWARWSQWIQIGLLFLLVASLLAALINFDPFGFKRATEKISSDILQLFIAGPLYESKAESLVTVVVIDDQFMRLRREVTVDRGGDNVPQCEGYQSRENQYPVDLKDHWPIPYIEQRRLLENILTYEPAAVFMDFLYKETHEVCDSPQWLAALMEENSSFVIIPELIENPSYDCNDPEKLPTIGEDDPEEQMVSLEPLHKEFRERDIVKAYLGSRGCGDLYPMYLAKNAPSPAMRMYQHYLCEKDNAVCKADLLRKSDEKNFSDKKNSDTDSADNTFIDPMYVQWRSKLGDNYKRFLGELVRNEEEKLTVSGEPPSQIDYFVCQNIGSSLGERIDYVSGKPFKALVDAFYVLRYSLSGSSSTAHVTPLPSQKEGSEISADSRIQFVGSFLGRPKQFSLYEPCVAISTVPASVLDYRTKRISDQEYWVKKLIKDNYVFLGVDIGLHPDRKANPLHGSLAGVYTHAMAFDNLVTYNENYLRPLPANIQFAVEAFALWLIFLIQYVLSKTIRRRVSALIWFVGTLLTRLSNISDIMRG